jgi:hypothetical protein
VTVWPRPCALVSHVLLTFRIESGRAHVSPREVRTCPAGLELMAWLTVAGVELQGTEGPPSKSGGASLRAVFLKAARVAGLRKTPASERAKGPSVCLPEGGCRQARGFGPPAPAALDYW